MAKLKIQTPDGKFLLIDATGYTPDQYDDLAAAALEDYNTKNEYAKYPGLQAAAKAIVGTDNPTDADIENAMNLSQKISTPIKAGMAGLGDIVSGEGLNQATETIGKVQAGEKPETTPGKVGEFVGGLVTPEQIALQAAGGAALEASGLGAWAADLLKGWGESAARTAIGNIKNIAKAMGLNKLEALSQFLLNSVKVGGKELPPIVTATNSTKDMLAAAQAIQNAAGAALGKISPAVDEALAKNPGAINLKAILEDLDRLSLAVKEVAPTLGKAVVNQYEAAIEDFLNVIKKETLSDNPQMFTALRELKTTIGNLVFKHGSPLESKAALEDAYAVLSRGIDAAAQALDKGTAAAFEEANAVYNKAYAVVEALTGKAISEEAKGFFADIPALGAAALGAVAHTPLGLIAAPVAFMTAKAAKAYGPQAVAAGLNAAAPVVGPLLTKGIPFAANAISNALNQ
jgi:hypothetical protein